MHTCWATSCWYPETPRTAMHRVNSKWHDVHICDTQCLKIVRTYVQSVRAVRYVDPKNVHRTAVAAQGDTVIEAVAPFTQYQEWAVTVPAPVIVFPWPRLEKVLLLYHMAPEDVRASAIND